MLTFAIHPKLVFRHPLIASVRHLRSSRRPASLAMKHAQPVSSTVVAVPPDLDRSLFNTNLHLYALLTPPALCHTLRKLLKAHLLTMPRTHVVVKPEGESSASMLLLSRYLARHPSATASNITQYPRGNIDDSNVDDASSVVLKLVLSCTADLVREASMKVKKKAKRKKNNSQHVNQDKNADCQDIQIANGEEHSANEDNMLETFIQNLSPNSLTVRPLRLSYEHCSIDHVLNVILPQGMTIPSSFEGVGHIAHVNLRDEHEPWKKLIGRVMLDKLKPRIRTVVNKLESTGGPYRTFAMEVLAGEDNFMTSVRENGCRFNLDFQNVYWNSRLETEHRRIIDLIQRDEIFVDAFCGVGPFAIPAAKRGKCKKVYANDLNPSSVKHLIENIALNSIPNANEAISTSCGCARAIISRLVKEEKAPISRVVMNFPAGAPEFLDVFRGLYNDWDGDIPEMPIVHCYCFIKGELETNLARDRVRKALFGDLDNARDSLSDDDIERRAQQQ